tara:strand:+ start:60 stop:1580 length:1521 start_codon:yes stop_codon:yes gene_type:complete
MGPLDLADIEELRVKQGQQRDKIENAPKDKAIQATDKAHKAGNITDREHIENLKNAPNYMQIIEDAFQTTKEGFKIGADAYTDAAKKGWGFAMDMSESMANDPAAMSEHTLDMFADFQAASKGAQAGSKFGPWGATGGAVGGVILRRGGKELVDKVFGLLRKGDEYVDAATGMKVDPTDSTYFMSKQTERMEAGFEANKAIIPKKNRATVSELKISKIDDFAKVTKSKIKKLVKQFGGTNADVDAIFQEQVVKFQNINNTKAWLNKYFNDLTAGLGPDGLKNARIKNVNGKPTLVDGRTLKTIDHPFEVDHQKAKELMNELGLEGADMHENLEIVLSVFNREKNNIGNPAIPDQIREAIGESTTLENFVRRRLDETFMLEGERVPQMFKQAAKIQMLDDAMHLKPGETLEQVIELRLKIYDDISNYLVEASEYIPSDVQRQIDKFTRARDLNPQEYLQHLKDTGIYDRLTGRLKRLHDKLSDDWINLKRGLRSRPSTKYMQEGHDV